MLYECISFIVNYEGGDHDGVYGWVSGHEVCILECS